MNKPISSYNLDEKNKLQIMTKQKRKIKTAKMSIKSTASRSTILQFSYRRYADDWIILSNANFQTLQQLNDDISNWLLENLE